MTDMAPTKTSDRVTVGVNAIMRFPRAMKALARLGEFGCKKYNVSNGDRSFVDTPDAYNVFVNKIGRHMVDEALEGPINSEDDGQAHPVQRAWNAMAAAEVWLKENPWFLEGKTMPPVRPAVAPAAQVSRDTSNVQAKADRDALAAAMDALGEYPSEEKLPEP